MSVVVMKLPITVANSCGLLNHPNSFHGGMFKLKAKSDADSFLYSHSHLECNGHTVHAPSTHLPPPLTSTVKLSLFMYVHSIHSPWLPGYIDAAQAILIILTVAGLFPDRPCVCVCVCVEWNREPRNKS